MNKLGKLICAFVVLIGSLTIGTNASYAAVSWESVGTVGFGAGTHNSLALDRNGVPYVAYAASSAIFVQRYVSDKWENVPATASFAMRANDMVKLAFDNQNALYMVFNNTGNGNQVEVDKLVNGVWEHVGNANISTANGYYQNLVFDSLNRPYIAFTDFGQSTKTRVLTLDNGTWKNVGSSLPWNNSTTSASLGIAPDDSLYVAFVDASDSNKVKVYKYSGGAWSMVGSALGMGVNSNYTIKLKMGSGGIPYVDYIDGAQSSKLTVKRFINGSWETLGNAGFSLAADTFMSFDLDSADVPYVAFGADSYKAHVMRFVDGVWEYVGGSGFLSDVNRITVAADPANNVYFHYKSTTSTNLGVYYAKLPLTDVKATGGNGEATLSFSQPTGATNVVVEQSGDGGASWAVSTTSGAVTASATSATVTGLANSTTYRLRLNVTGGLKPGISNWAAATPHAPLGDVAASAGDAQVNLTFSAPTGATSVVVEQSSDGGGNWMTATTSSSVTASSTSATVTGLSNGTTYLFRLKVTDGSYSGISNTATATPSGQVANLAATAGDGQAELTFSAPTGATSVVVEQSSDGGDNWATATTSGAVTASSTSATVTGLVNGTTYKFRLVVTGGLSAGLSNEATAKPLAPLTNLAATAGDGQAALTFGAPTGATSVVVEQSSDGGANWATATTSGAVTASSTSATVTGLVNGTMYKFRLAVTGGAHEGNSNVVSALPSLPIADLAATGGTGQATLTFGAPTGATSVTVEQSGNGGASWTTATTSGPVTASSTNATVTGLVNGTAYKFRLVVTGGANNGVSNEASAMPAAPLSDLTATPGNGEVELAFGAPTGATHVVVEQSSNGGTSWATATTSGAVTASSTSATVTGLVNGTAYKFRLVVTGGAHEGNSNAASALPSLPIADLAAAGSPGQATLTFSAPTGATSVTVEQSSDGGANWTAATTGGAVTASSTSATVTGLVNGTTYKFRLVVTGGASNGVSNEVAATPTAPPTDLAATGGVGQATLTFSASAGATSVAVEQSSDGGANWTTATTSGTVTASSTSATVTGLANGTTYKFRLKITGGASAGLSNVATAKPLAPLTDLSATAGNGQTTLTFSAPTGATNVTVEQSSDGGTNWTTATTSGAVTASSTSATVTGLVNGTTYKFRLVVTGGAHEGNSNAASALPSLPIADLAAAGSPGQATLTFSAPIGATNVTLQQSSDGGTNWTATSVAVTASSTSATVTGLVNGTTYKFRLVVTGGASNGVSNEAAATPTAPPTDLAATGGVGQATLTFSASAGATSVVVEQSSDGGANWTTATTSGAVTASSTSATVTGLANGTTYKFRLKITGGASAGLSNVATAKPLAPLTDLSATAGNGQTTLTFSAPTGATNVTVEQSSDGGANWTTATTSGAVAASSTSATVTGLANGTTYKFRLVVTGGAHEGNSNAVSTLPSLPIADLAAAGSPGQATLTFSAPTGATSVMVEQSSDGGAIWTAATTGGAVTASSTSATVTGLINGTTYKFRLVVTGGASNGVSNEAAATPTAPPTDLAATGGVGQATLTFSASAGATSIVVEQSSDGGVNWTTATTSGAVTASSTSATVTGLANGTTYKFRLKITGGASAGLSNVATAKPLAPLTDLSATAGNGQATLTFSAPTGATNVTVEQSSDGGTNWTTATTSGAVTASTTSATVTGLANGTTYKFRLAVTGGAHEGNSNAVSTLPSLPIADLAAAGSPGQATLTFSAPTGATSLTVEQSSDGGANWTTATTGGAVTASSTSATVTGLVNGTTYKFRLAVSGGPSNGVSNEAAATPTAPPTDLTATANDGQVSLKFSAPTGATSVTVEQSSDGGANWTPATTNGAVAASATSATVTGLTNGKAYRFRLVIAGGAHAGISNTADATPSTAPATTERISLVVDNGSSDMPLAAGTIWRTSNPDGTKNDLVTYEAAQALDTLNKAKQKGASTIRLVIPDAKDEVSRLEITLPKATVATIASGNVGFEMYTANVRLILPRTSMNSLDEELYFRLVPLKKAEEQQAVEQRVQADEQVKKAAGSGAAQILARPVTIDTNLSSRTVQLVLPLRGIDLPAGQAARDRFLSALFVYIEHSDGQKELVKAKPQLFEGNVWGLSFNVTKFSTFTIVKVAQHNDGNGQAVTHQAYIEGYPDHTFRPANPITRAEIAALLSRLQLGAGGQEKSIAYTDVPGSYWAAAAIDYATVNGLMHGYDGGRFGPTRPITRAELAAVIARMLGLAESGAAAANDIDGHWAQADIRKVMAAGFMTAGKDGRFRPDDKLTRAETVTVLNRILHRGPLYGVSAPTWRDAPAAHWAFADIEEASRTHDAEIGPDGTEMIKP
ncbi:S-layer homology domain-containing protein [Cohnella sp. 56]|uniref:S-layer homology domain-containing protein n=1 Tax=Cohnella sp. 56 TaxID=3113722 RepID=UPI0030E7892B